RHLYVLYAYRSMHGTGVGQDLLDAVIDPSVTTALWVADPNPRAQAFYSKNGFIADGTIKTDDYDGMRELRMVRQAQAQVRLSQRVGRNSRRWRRLIRVSR